MIAFIRDHIRENPSVGDLADHFHLHPDYLSRLFKQHAHTSVGNYITLQRINVAQQLLREGHTVTQVQEELGYSSYSYFFKTFKKITGISPAHFG